MLSDLARQAVLNLLINGNPNLNTAFAANCQAASVPVPTPPHGNSGEPFTFTLKGKLGSPTFWNGIASIDQLETQGMIQYPFLMIGSMPEKQDPGWRVRPSTFSGTLAVDLRLYLAWYVREPPDANDFNAQLEYLKRGVYESINGPANQALWLPATTAQWGTGQLIYNGDLNCVLEGPMQLTNDATLWRRELRFVVTMRGIL